MTRFSFAIVLAIFSRTLLKDTPLAGGEWPRSLL
ncbi:MAG: hypothetical protein A4E51_00939 [Methanosaeta sp. PtaU1.Bin055]|nr:MAG: hypothetical protein A4E51_00939 [Methanosaeta sp. PtaU1.Bin055]